MGDEIAIEFLPLIRVYKDGRVERLIGNEVVPPSVDPTTGVQSKDVVICPQTGLSARLYLPKNANPAQKLPLLVYLHGGAFVVESAFSPTYQLHLNSLASQANAVAVSVSYRRAPEDPVPTAHEDSWTAIKWAASHASGDGPDPWLKDYVDFDRVFFGGDSVGGGMAHHMAIRVGSQPLDNGFKLVGIFLSCPYFWGKEPLPNETTNPAIRDNVENLWKFVCPTTSGVDDPLMNPETDPKFSSLGCNKVLVFVAEKDYFRERGWYYYESLVKSSWGGKVNIDETKGEDHIFFLNDPSSHKSIAVVKKIAALLNKD